MLPATSERVPLHTAAEVNEEIRRRGEESIAHYADTSTAAIAHRLHELDQEWDIERALEANAATVVLLSVALGATVSRRFLFFPAVVAGFLLQHALQGWCPPVPILRRLGFRTEKEIGREKKALEAILVERGGGR